MRLVAMALLVCAGVGGWVGYRATEQHDPLSGQERAVRAFFMLSGPRRGAPLSVKHLGGPFYGVLYLKDNGHKCVLVDVSTTYKWSYGDPVEGTGVLWYFYGNRDPAACK